MIQLQATDVPKKNIQANENGAGAATSILFRKRMFSDCTSGFPPLALGLVSIYTEEIKKVSKIKDSDERSKNFQTIANLIAYEPKEALDNKKKQELFKELFQTAAEAGKNDGKSYLKTRETLNSILKSIHNCTTFTTSEAIKFTSTIIASFWNLKD